VTRFTEDEEMTRDAARQWAQQDLKPIVREMDNESKLRPSVIQSLFEMGFMGMVSSDKLMQYFDDANQEGHD
jgi:alkylation response protein AidB-like acyl-CoA dehydrogenase